MEKKKINSINWIGFILTAACFIYTFVIYIIMFVAEPTNFALRMASGQGAHYVGKIIICIAMFLVFLTALVAVPVFFSAKADGRKEERKSLFGKIIIGLAAAQLLLVIIFWIMQGPVFDGDATNAESTIYRIIDLVVSLAAFGAIWMLVMYAPRYDTLLALKKKKSKLN